VNVDGNAQRRKRSREGVVGIANKSMRESEVPLKKVQSVIQALTKGIAIQHTKKKH
jgi:hypothetical protein